MIQFIQRFKDDWKLICKFNVSIPLASSVGNCSCTRKSYEWCNRRNIAYMNKKNISKLIELFVGHIVFVDNEYSYMKISSVFVHCFYVIFLYLKVILYVYVQVFSLFIELKRYDCTYVGTFRIRNQCPVLYLLLKTVWNMWISWRIFKNKCLADLRKISTLVFEGFFFDIILWFTNICLSRKLKWTRWRRNSQTKWRRTSEVCMWTLSIGWFSLENEVRANQLSLTFWH